MTHPRLDVTDTEIMVNGPCPGSPELAALKEWFTRLGVDLGPLPFVCGYPIVRDVERRQVRYTAGHQRPVPNPPYEPWEVEAWIDWRVVQLEAAPPPWPAIFTQ